MSSGASNFIESVDGVFIAALAVAIFFLLLITVLMLVFVFKYSRKKNPKATNIHSSTWLEVTWTIIPTILVMILFWYGWTGYKEMSDIPEDALTIDVTAQMWKWNFQYEGGIQSDTLYVPVNQPVVVVMHSNDVNHAFFIPAFRIKKDVYPGRERKAWFIAQELGEYDIACAEYCGLNHSGMYAKVVVLPEDEFANWLYNR